jgi:hypothetical protein
MVTTTDSGNASTRADDLKLPLVAESSSASLKITDPADE